MIKLHLRRPLLVAAGLFTTTVIAGQAAPAAAGPLFDTSLSSCTGTNCSSISVGGTILAFGSSFASPWVGQIFAGRGECLRLDVTQENNDLELVVVSPDGQSFQNDDRNGAADRRPLVKVTNTDPGWYTVQVSEFLGRPIDADFTLAFGRYNGTNSNCASPTAPSAAAVADATAKGSASGGSIGPRATGGPQAR